MTSTPIADMVEVMLAQNVPATAIVLAVRTYEQGVTGDASRDVTGDGLSMKPSAVRMRKLRAERRKNAGEAIANDVANTAVTERHTVTSQVTRPCDLSSSFSLVVEEDSQGSKEEKKGTLVVARARGTRLPADWQPSEADRAFAVEHGLDADAMRAEFVDYWIGVPGSRGVKLNWSATWRNRIRDRGNKHGGLNARSRQAGANPIAGSAQTHGDAVLAGMARVAARYAQNKFATGGGQFQGGPDAAGQPDAEQRSDDGDRGLRRQPLLLFDANAGERRGVGGGDAVNDHEHDVGPGRPQGQRTRG